MNMSANLLSPPTGSARFHLTRRARALLPLAIAAGLFAMAAGPVRGATPVLSYDFENVQNGSLTDVSGHGLAGTMTGGSLTYDLDRGSTVAQMGRLDLPNSGSTPAFNLSSSSFSISTWMKVPLISGSLPNSIQSIFVNGGGGYLTAGIRFYLNDWNTANGKLVMELANGTAGSAVATAANAYPLDGAWHLVTATIDRAAGSGLIYIDGNIRANATSGLRQDFPVSTASDRVGQFLDGGFQFQGAMDNFTIYDGVLTQPDILAMVPEPSSLSLLALGGFSLMLWRRRN